MDDLEEVDIRDEILRRPTYISVRLTPEQKEKCQLLKGYMCCFAWDYTEMPELSRELVKHWLLIKAEFRPYKQAPRRFKLEIIGRVKEEVDHLLQVGFIQSCRYAEWVSNIVPVEKKSMEKIRICVDFINLNWATPKDST
jgi:hypothetical protein